MTDTATFSSSRRAFLSGIAVTMACLHPSSVLARGSGGDPSVTVALRARPGRARLRPEPAGETEIWGFDGRLAPPVLRARRGDELDVTLINETPADLAFHWHGQRRVSVLASAPAKAGETSRLRLPLSEPGFLLARPGLPGASAQPAERGLSALLVVEEAEPPAVAADVALLIDDWLLSPDGSLASFGAEGDAAVAGRLGNVLGVSGGTGAHRIEARPGSWLRLRMANGCNARALRLRFEGLRVLVAAIDSQPADGFRPLHDSLPFAPGTRYDLFVQLALRPQAEGRVVAMLGPGLPLVEIVPTGDPVGDAAEPGILPPNPSLPASIPLQNALRRELVIEGGAAGPPSGRSGAAAARPASWRISGEAGSLTRPPSFRAKPGTAVVLALVNRTAQVQHLSVHGHAVRLLHALDDGWEPYWLDTVTVPEGRTVRIAFTAGTPGRWLIASSNLERFDAGLWTWFEVT